MMNIIENKDGQLQFDFYESGNWSKLKDWVEEQMEERKYMGDAYRYTAYEAVLKRMKELERD